MPFMATQVARSDLETSLFRYEEVADFDDDESGNTNESTTGALQRAATMNRT